MNKLQEKNLLCDVWDAYFYDDKDNLVFFSENLTQANIEGASDETEVRNGKGNGLFAKLYSNKTITVTLSTNAFDFSTLALLAGTSVGTGKGTCYTPSLTLDVKDSKITLPNIPKDSTMVELFIKGVKVESTKYEIEDNTITFSDETIVTDTDVKILPYEFNMISTGEDYKEITIGANDFPSAGKLVLKTLEKNKLTQAYKDLTIIIPQAQPASKFTLSTSSEVKPSETEITLSALVDNGRLMKVIESPHIEQ